MSQLRRSFGFDLCVAIHTDVGRVRTNNEDSHGFAWLDDGSLFVIVADGMGGHEAGEVASGLAVQVVEEVVGREVQTDPRERLYNGLLEANEAILDEGKSSGTRGMGTTAITGIFKGPEIHVGLVGDSRLYHVRRGHMVWRTLDHTRVQMLLDQGEISDEEARHHPEAGMLTRALGHSRMADGRPLVPDVLEDPIYIEATDAVILSSDGLHDLMEDWEISQMIAGHTPDEAAQLLIQAACERGGHDNITVAVVTVGERCADFDPDFVPETEESEPDEEVLEEEVAEVEITYDDVKNEPMRVAELSSEPAAAGNSSLMLGGIAFVVLIAVIGGGTLVALAAAGLLWANL
jgi:PPM family protein phosphatase